MDILKLVENQTKIPAATRIFLRWSDPSGADATGILDKEGNLVGGSFTGQDAIDAFNLLAGFSAAEKLEVTVQEIMVIDTAPDGDEGGGGDGNGGGNGKGGPKSKKGTGNNGKPTYNPAPKELPGFPGAEKLRNGKGLRQGWRLPNGDLAEWDSAHGELEVYDKSGKTHKGAYDPDTGQKKKEGEKGRKASRAKFDVPFESTSPYRNWKVSPQATITPPPPSAYAAGALVIIMILLIPIGI